MASMWGGISGTDFTGVEVWLEVPGDEDSFVELAMKPFEGPTEEK